MSMRIASLRRREARSIEPGVLCVIMLVMTLAGTMPLPAAERESSDSMHELAAGYRDALHGRWEVAQRSFGEALRSDLRNPRLQFLNGLAYARLASSGDSSYRDLAKVGFQNAARLGSGNFWANLYLGYMQLDDSDYAAAQATFSSAVRDQPQRWEGLYGLGVASYYLGDLAVARLAVDAAQKLHGVDGAGAVSIQRLQLMVSAAGADPASNELAADYARVNPGDRLVLKRVSELSRDANASQLDADPAAGGAGAAGEAPPNNQVLVDVTLILSSMLDTYNRGVNLFDGLSVQYGYGNNFSASRAAGAEWNSNRSITHGISVPQLNYSLNLFNNAGQFYQVLARPSLTAYLGRESEFFAGRTINVRVSGVNLGTLQPIDVGVGLKVTPEALNAKKVTFRVSASRSFLSREQIGTFQESLTTFKQLVSATAEVEFGQTLVLSALSESVQDSTVSKTPGLSQIPGLSTFFKKSTTANRQESLLILITPVLPTAIRVRENLRPATVDKLISMWNNLIDPRSSVDAILDRFGRSPFFRGAQSGDLRWRQVITPQLGEEALRENAQLAGLID